MAPPSRSSPRTLLLAAGLSVALAATAVAGGAGGRDRDPRVRVATSGNKSELVKTIPITRTPGTERRVVMSLGPGRLPGIVKGDEVEVTAELMVSTDCRTQQRRCAGSAYGYDPRIRAQLVLATGRRAKGGRRVMPISPRRRETCTQSRPHYEHHCVLVFGQAGFRALEPRRLPCKLARCHVNLVADVHHPRARRNDVLIVGGARPSGRIHSDRGRINAIRLRDTRPSDFRRVATHRLSRRVMAPDLRRRVVISKRLRGLRRHEQLSVAAGFREDISNLPYSVRTSAYLVLAESPRAVRPGDFVKRRALGFGEIAENNGSNCTKPPSRCTYRKVGVLAMRGDAATRRGREKPLFVNLVTVLGPKVRDAHGDDRVRFRKGWIRIVRFPPRLRR